MLRHDIVMKSNLRMNVEGVLHCQSFCYETFLFCFLVCLLGSHHIFLMKHAYFFLFVILKSRNVFVKAILGILLLFII